MLQELITAGAAYGIEIAHGRAALLLRYAELIEKWNQVRNLVARADPETLLHTHLIDCVSVVPFVPGRAVADVGSGAGLPGIVIAILKPDIKVWLIESNAGKARFLEQVRIELDLTNVTIVNQRIRDWQSHVVLDAIICRGYACLRRFIDDTRHLHGAATQLIAMKGEAPTDEVSACRELTTQIVVHPVDVPAFRHRHVVVISP